MKLKRHPRLTDAAAIATGAVFLLSGVMKATDAASFALVLQGYGIRWLPYLAPPVIITEIIIGLFLCGGIWLRRTAMAAAGCVVVFTAVFTYGLLLHKVDDCGCFGRIEVLNTSPVLLYVRNSVLLLLSLSVILTTKPMKAASPPSAAALCAVAAAIGLASFTCGTTFRLPKTPREEAFMQPVALSRSPLGRFVTTSPDSTYLVFAFSYRCPHCMNSIANLKEYERKGAVDKVIGLAVGDSVAAATFIREFAPDFTIRDCGKSLSMLTNEFPKAYYIEGDSIIADFSGELPCAQVFVSTLKKRGHTPAHKKQN